MTNPPPPTASARPNPAASSPVPVPPIPVLLDTDIATDPDDILALLAIAASPELDLVAITATYGDTLLRARITHQTLRWLGLDVPIGAGATETMSGAPIWYAGNEMQQLDASLVDPGFEPLDAAQLIVDSARAHPSTLVVRAIGPLTNLADALALEPSLASLVASVAIMGGDFGDPAQAEHNFRCDADAAAIVATSGLQLRYIGVEQTRLLPLRADDRATMLDAPSGVLRSRLHDDLDWWMNFSHSDDILVHDSLAVMMITHPDLFEFSSASAIVNTEPDGAGRVELQVGGSVEYVADMHTDELRQLIVGRVRGALRTAAR